MGWWKRFKDWLKEDPNEKPVKSWSERDYSIPFPSVPPMPADLPAEERSGSDAADTAMPNKITDGESEVRSGEKVESGVGYTPPVWWYPAETIEGEPPKVEEPLEHADSLPGATFRVFPCAGNHRNSYDSESSVRRAVAARKGDGFWKQSDNGHVWVPDVIKVYEARTVWRDVTSEYVKP